jgi:hypothetical protein
MNQERPGEERNVDKEMLTMAKQLILENFGRHLLVTFPIAYQGIFVESGFALISAKTQSLLWFSLVLFGNLCLLSLLAIIKRRMQFFILFFPAWFSFVFYSFFSHNIPRYNESLIPCYWLAAILQLYLVYQFMAAHKRTPKLQKSAPEKKEKKRKRQ